MKYGYQEVDDNADFEVEPVSGIEAPAKLQGYTVVIRWRITSGKHAGSYIGEAYQGLPHPMLIIPASDVSAQQSVQPDGLQACGCPAGVIHYGDGKAPCGL